MNSPQEHLAAPSLLPARDSTESGSHTPLTPQQVFDNALNGVIAQGGFSKTNSNNCVYRAGSLKCGIGHSIPDAIYASEFDHPPREGPMSILHESGTDVATLCQASPEVDGIFARCGGKFLSDLQEAHDKAEVMDDFRERMRLVATKHGLTYTEPVAKAGAAS